MVKKDHPLNRFQIGDWVVVKATVESEKYWLHNKPIKGPPKKKVTRTELPTMMRGQVVGASQLYEGEIGSDYEYGNYFIPSKRVPVWLVRYGLTNKAVKVLDEDIEHWSSGKKLPIRYCEPLCEKDRQWLKETMKAEMANWPRNEKGQWIKKEE